MDARSGESKGGKYWFTSGVDRLLQHPVNKTINEATANLPEDQYSLIVPGNEEGFRVVKDFSATGVISMHSPKEDEGEIFSFCCHWHRTERSVVSREISRRCEIPCLRKTATVVRYLPAVDMTIDERSEYPTSPAGRAAYERHFGKG